MMAIESAFRAARGDGYQAIELPYDGDRLTMLVVVPERLARFERTLTPEGVDAIVARLRARTVDLTLPTFSARTAAPLKEPLQALGIHALWSPETADLSGITDEPGLFVGAVVHEAFVSVAEQGTEAAAATAVEMGDSGLERPPLEFKVDRPFVWLIRDRETGTILFMGRVVDPRSTSE